MHRMDRQTDRRGAAFYRLRMNAELSVFRTSCQGTVPIIPDGFLYSKKVKSFPEP